MYVRWLAIIPQKRAAETSDSLGALGLVTPARTLTLLGIADVVAFFVHADSSPTITTMSSIRMVNDGISPAFWVNQTTHDPIAGRGGLL